MKNEGAATSRAKGGRPRRDDLQPQDYRAITALMTNPSHRAAAAEIGVSPRTLSRMMRNPKFAAEFDGQVSALRLELWARMLSKRDEVLVRFDQLVQSDSEAVALRATLWFLERVLGQPEALSLELALIANGGPTHLVDTAEDSGDALGSRS
jgi:hypothetical protein